MKIRRECDYEKRRLGSRKGNKTHSIHKETRKESDFNLMYVSLQDDNLNVVRQKKTKTKTITQKNDKEKLARVCFSED